MECLKKETEYMQGQDRDAVVSALTIMKNRMSKDEADIERNSFLDNLSWVMMGCFLVFTCVATAFLKFKTMICNAVMGSHSGQAAVPLSSVYSRAPFGQVART